jgi:MarR family transcriptional regulator, transcriptional regulator for hemolysin
VCLATANILSEEFSLLGKRHNQGDRTLVNEDYSSPQGFCVLLNLLSSRSSPRQALQLKIAFHVIQTARRWQGAFADMKRVSGKGAAGLSALYYLENSPTGLTQTELAKRLKISGPSLTRQLDKLEAQGLVTRRRMLGDGRARLIVMEDAGREALFEMDAIASAMRDRLFEGVSEADLEATNRVLDVLASRLAVDPGLVSEED